MNYKFGLFFLSLLFFPLISFGNVDITSTIYLPQINGLRHDVISEEVGFGGLSKSYPFSISEDDLSSLLKSLDLPPVSEEHTYTREIPQCKAQSVHRKASYQVSLSDEEWLKHQSAWCRFTRSLIHDSGKFCRPEKTGDILKYGIFSAKEPESVEVLREWVHDENGRGCHSVLGDQSARMDRLKRCAENPNEANGCRDLFNSQSFQEVGKNYEVTLVLEVSQEHHEKTLPRTETYYSEKTLTQLSLGSLTLSPTVLGMGTSLSLDELMNQFGSDLNESRLPVSATYDVTQEGTTKKVEQSARMRVDKEVIRLKNYPSMTGVMLRKKDIVALEEVSDMSEELQKVLWLQRHCSRPPQNGDYFLPFGHFVCFEKGADLETFAKRAQMRFRFVDTEGQERSLTWERKAPASDCYIKYLNPSYPEKGETIECSIPDSNQSKSSDRPDLEKWVSDPSKDLREFMNDPAYGDNAYLRFSVSNFIPKAHPENPLKNFVTSQSTDVEIVGNVR